MSKIFKFDDIVRERENSKLESPMLALARRYKKDKKNGIMHDKYIRMFERRNPSSRNEVIYALMPLNFEIIDNDCLSEEDDLNIASFYEYFFDRYLDDDELWNCLSLMFSDTPPVLSLGEELFNNITLFNYSDSYRNEKENEPELYRSLESLKYHLFEKNNMSYLWFIQNGNMVSREMIIYDVMDESFRENVIRAFEGNLYEMILGSRMISMAVGKPVPTSILRAEVSKKGVYTTIYNVTDKVSSIKADQKEDISQIIENVINDVDTGDNARMVLACSKYREDPIFAEAAKE